MRFGLAGLVAALALVLAACGSSDSTTEGGSGAARTVTHKFGRSTVDGTPKRVVAVGFNDQDFALALGVKPVGARQFQGGIDITGRPWAQRQLGGTQPKLVGAEQIEFEKVAAERPDLILAVYSGIKKGDYDKLAQIAPTIAQGKENVDFGYPWERQLRLTGEALGREQQAAKVRATVDADFARAREQHPEFKGKSLTFAVGNGKEFYVYSEQDLRVRFFKQLGFTTPTSLQKQFGDKFFLQVSPERLKLIDSDVLVIYGEEKQLLKDPVFARLKAVREKRVIYLDTDGDLANALGFSSPLSLPYALDGFVPRLAAALNPS